MSMKPLVILVDLDGICADFMGTLVDMFNTYDANRGEEVDIDECRGRLPDWTPLGNDLWRYVNAPGFYQDLPPMPGAIDALGRLKDAGHDVTILTSPGKNPNAAAEKLVWIGKHMPFLHHHDAIITPKKHLVRGDVFIDDDQGKIEKMRAAWPSTKMLGIEWPYNTKDAELWDLLAPSYSNSEAAWTSILQAIERYAHE